MLTALAVGIPSLVAIAILCWLLETTRRELRLANDRLYAAWQSGALIPPRPEPVKKALPLVPLSPTLQEYVNDWEEPEAQTRAENEIREWLVEGKTENWIIRTIEDRKGL